LKFAVDTTIGQKATRLRSGNNPEPAVSIPLDCKNARSQRRLFTLQP
jgi:hypothetical protein